MSRWVIALFALSLAADESIISPPRIVCSLDAPCKPPSRYAYVQHFNLRIIVGKCIFIVRRGVLHVSTRPPVMSGVFEKGLFVLCAYTGRCCCCDYCQNRPSVRPSIVGICACPVRELFSITFSTLVENHT